MGRSGYHMQDVAQEKLESLRAGKSECWSRDRAAKTISRLRRSFSILHAGMLSGLLLFLVLLQSGCGATGYAGGAISSLTVTAITLDAGQSMAIGANGVGSLPVQWTLSGQNCTSDACGTISGASAAGVTYNAPAWTSTPEQVTLNAAIAGTKDTRTVTVNVNPAPGISGNPPSATVGVPYSFKFTTTGGTAPSKLTLQSGTLPAGLTFDPATGRVSGTPTAGGTAKFVLQLVDSSDIPNTVTATETITVGTNSTASGLTVINGNLPIGVVGTAYTTMLQAGGGPSPYTWAAIAGSLPAGLTLNATTGVISGTPAAAGTSPFTAQVTDMTGNTASGAFSITVVAANPAAPVITSGTLGNGTVNVPYTAPINVTGGTAPYTCALVSGMPPAGLTLNANCTLAGTPTTATTSTFVVKVTDSGKPQQSGTGSVTVTINPAQNLTVASPPPATVGTPYAGTIAIGNGTAPYLCRLVSGTLPAGLMLNSNCTVTGMPTSPGTVTINVQVIDSGNPQKMTTAPVTITVNPAPLALANGALPNGTVGVTYAANVGVTGGTAPYTCVLANGTLPAGLTLNADCSVSGTPTVAGTQTVTVRATDSANPAQSTTGQQTITIGAAPNLTISSPLVATANTPYTGTVPVNGGTAPYSCVLVSGTMPAGLTLNADCTVTGTPATAGTTTVQVRATDSTTPTKVTGTGPVTITVQQPSPLTFTGSTPNAVVNQPYTQTLAASGGVAPYTYTLTSGALPDGITLSSSGVVSGTPTKVGASVFTVTATDSQGTPKSASLPLVLLVTYPPTPNDALLSGPYAFLFQGYDDVVAGVLAYNTATAGSIVADGNGAITDGEQDSNRQVSNPAGNTVATSRVLGTYTVGTDRRGSLALTTLNADGTVGGTRTYAIALRAPVAPATNSAKGSLIEFDGDQLVGTKGSGTLLAQTAAALTTGLNGSYAFGLSGDTPCLPSCTIGINAGPVATVGQFTAAANSITGGTADTNIASAVYANSSLSGSFTAADTYGRIQLNLASANLAGMPYPTDFAAYVVDSSHVVLLSTDKHSAYILQAGTATLQTQTTFGNTSLNGGFVGWENATANPGLLGTTLQNTLNLSTATIFRGTGNGSGTCTTTNVDFSGTTGVVSHLTGLVNAPLVTALLGSYQSLGNSTCAVTANGRAVLNYPASNALLMLTLQGLGLPTTPAPRVAYLTGPNQGYFLETGYAALGMLEAQSGGPYRVADLNGTYIYGSAPASTLAGTNTSGVFTADGAGTATSTVDRNVGVGTINVLQLGVRTSATYNITDAAAGRFLLSTGEVFYEISPGRFVLLQPEALNTSPYVALLF